MKKHLKKALCVFLCITMLIGCMSVGVYAENGPDKKYTYVFVHGLCGWGDDDGANAVFPYWGMGTGNIFKDLRKNGYKCVGASVGTISSAWDRACELYAQLEGTRVDYGAAHSAKHGHKRYGKTYSEPIVKNWNSKNKINLIGHSFGGATVRLFVQLLAEGSPEERAATSPQELSPLFIGGMSDRVYSVTALAAPHNGTPFFEAMGGFTDGIVSIFTLLASICGTTVLNDYFDPMLEQFGIERDPNAKPGEMLDRETLEFLINSEDTAFFDLTIDGAARLNAKIKTQPEIYYYSYSTSKTSRSLFSSYHTPDVGMNALFLPFSCAIGRFTGVTKGGYVIDKSWYENDGLVSRVSSKAPFTEKSVKYRLGMKTRPGVWYEMKTMDMDHLAICGGMLNESRAKVRIFYLSHLAIVEKSGRSVFF